MASFASNDTSNETSADEAAAEASSPCRKKIRKTRSTVCFTKCVLAARNAKQASSGRFMLNWPGRKRKGQAVDAAVLQALGGVGNASMLDHDEKLPVRVLLYRLVSLAHGGPWKDGLLPGLARKFEGDEDLEREVFEFLATEWRHDPIRSQIVLENEAALSEASCPAPEPKHGTVFSAARAATRMRPETGRRSRAAPNPADVEDKHETWADVLLHGRGTVGETALHLCCLLGTPPHQRLIRVLVPWLANQRVRDVDGEEVCALDASYMGQPYNGEVALHFAVVQQDLKLVKLLVEHGASVHPHASGDFLYSNVNLYFGGTILGFAACLNNQAIVDYLIEAGADPNAVDKGPASSNRVQSKVHKGIVTGNSVLHCCVLHERNAMYRHLTTQHHAAVWTTNKRGDTPLLLATKVRSVKMAQAAMDAQRHTIWTFGPVTCLRYPLYEIVRRWPRTHSMDPPLPPPRARNSLSLPKPGHSGVSRVVQECDYNWGRSLRRGVLQVIDDEDVSELLTNEVIWKVTKDKWTAFAVQMFALYSTLQFVVLIALLISLLCDVDEDGDDWPAELGLASFVVILVITAGQAARLIVTQQRLNKPLLHMIVDIIACLLPWMALPLRFVSTDAELWWRYANVHTEYRVLIGLTSALMWSRFMSETFKATKVLGPLVLMVRSIAIKNVLPFLALYGGFFCMWLTLLFGIYKGMGASTGLWDTTKLLFRFTINPDNALPPGDARRFVGGATATIVAA